MELSMTAEPLAGLLERVERELLATDCVRSVDPHDPVRVENPPQPWTVVGCGNYAAVFLHPGHPDLVVKVYAPGREQGIALEAEVYRRIGRHPALSECFHVGGNYLVLRRLHGRTLYDCVRHGIRIPPQAIADIDAALKYAVLRGLHPHDVHGRNLMLHQGRGFIVDLSDFLNPEPCRAWQDLRQAYRWLYRPLIAPLRLRLPGSLLDATRRCYRLYRHLLHRNRRC
ncbi:serine/threonine protein kinase [Synechococcus sp. CBW1004]|uniref:serine/threonine protein kinase n=1 Tax=Synechococcus sp. CBW1004 TaxID=1353136 RepID=UPI001E4F03BB|nr:serine/threonine protein kinase [Synechococcus sp. CBW1004]